MLEMTYFTIAEIQADYEVFVGDIIPDMVRSVLFLLAFYCRTVERVRKIEA